MTRNGMDFRFGDIPVAAELNGTVAELSVAEVSVTVQVHLRPRGYWTRLLWKTLRVQANLGHVDVKPVSEESMAQSGLIL